MQITGKVIIARGSDPFTPRELAEMAQSRAWEHFIRRIDFLIEGERKTLETAADIDTVRKAQGSIEALRRVKLLPKIIADELRGN
jgi:hypothetical protein